MFDECENYKWQHKTNKKESYGIAQFDHTNLNVTLLCATLNTSSMVNMTSRTCYSSKIKLIDNHKFEF